MSAEQIQAVAWVIAACGGSTLALLAGIALLASTLKGDGR